MRTCLTRLCFCSALSLLALSGCSSDSSNSEPPPSDTSDAGVDDAQETSADDGGSDVAPGQDATQDTTNSDAMPDDATTADAEQGDAGAVAKVIATGCGNPWAIQVDQDWVYWAEMKTDSILRAPKAGGGTPTSLFQSTETVYFFVVDQATEGRVYVSVGSEVRSFRKDGTDAGVFATVAGDAFGLAISGDQLYVAYETNPESPNHGAAVGKVPLAGGALTVLAQTKLLYGGLALSVDDTDAYVTGMGGLVKVNKTTGTAVKIASFWDGDTIVSGPSHVFMVREEDWDGVASYAKTDGAEKVLFEKASIRPVGVAVHGSDVFALTKDGNVLKWGDSGQSGAPQVWTSGGSFASGLIGVQSQLTLDDTHLYWSAHKEGKIFSAEH